MRIRAPTARAWRANDPTSEIGASPCAEWRLQNFSAGGAHRDGPAGLFSGAAVVVMARPDAAGRGAIRSNRLRLLYLTASTPARRKMPRQALQDFRTGLRAASHYSFFSGLTSS